MELPLDVLVNILAQLSPCKEHHPDSIRVFVAFLEASSLLREAAQMSSLWRPHYLTRYMHSNALEESQRLSACNGDWRLRYIARRHLDRKALRLLNNVVAHREGQLTSITLLFNMSFDAWDVLEIESEQPVPHYLRSLYDQMNIAPDIKVAPHAITRRFWARCLMDSIARSYAINLWNRQQRGDDSITFVESFSALSCFSGVPPNRICSLLGDFTRQCREYLQEKKCVVSRHDQGYDLIDLCTKICHFMHSKGFGAVEAGSFHNLNNIFPHKYLTTNKKSIPISLVHIFVAIARGLDITASPVDFPQRVLVHVLSLHKAAEDFYVDVFGAETKMILSLREDIVERVMRHGIPPHSMAPYISPSASHPMLLRTSRNILASLNANIVPSEQGARVPLYLAFILYLLITAREQFAARATAYMGLVDCITVLPHTLVPIFPEGNAVREHLEDKRRTIVDMHEKSVSVSLRSSEENKHVKYHVGMIFQHRHYKYLGCICAWDNFCKQDESWIKEMHVDTLARDRHQPFYTSFALDGSERYVAEDNIQPVTATLETVLKFFPQINNMAVYFGDVEVNKSSERARLVLSPELQCAFPEDDALSHGLLLL